jgi:hypothetical protein
VLTISWQSFKKGVRYDSCTVAFNSGFNSRNNPGSDVQSRSGRWHDLKNGEIPLNGIPVLTEYVNKVGRYHGFRVDTYSTKRQEWVEATAWDQEVIRYAEIKHDHS